MERFSRRRFHRLRLLLGAAALRHGPLAGRVRRNWAAALADGPAPVAPSRHNANTH